MFANCPRSPRGNTLRTFALLFCRRRREAAAARPAGFPSQAPGVEIPHCCSPNEVSMKRSIVYCVVAGMLLTGLTGVGIANPEWVADAGLDFWNLPRLNGEMDRLQRHGEELEQQARAVMLRLNTKMDIVDEVYNCNLTLSEAALRFRNLNQANPKFIEHARALRPECSDDELQYWNVIDTARNSFIRYPDERQFVARLTDELHALQRRGETRLGK